jgi:hypothetical protein
MAFSFAMIQTEKTLVSASSTIKADLQSRQAGPSTEFVGIKGPSRFRSSRDRYSHVGAIARRQQVVVTSYQW